MTFWTKDGLTVYKDPYVLGTEKADSKLASFKPIKVSRAAQTHAGTYYLADVRQKKSRCWKMREHTIRKCWEILI